MRGAAAIRQDRPMSIDCGSPRVLVMDDDADVLASLERGLRLSAFDVATAKDGAEALRSATHTRPDAIVVDINLPVLDGVSAVTALRAMDKDVPVCVLSARSSVDDRVPGLEARRRRLSIQAVRVGRVGCSGTGTAARAKPGRHVVVGDDRRRRARSRHSAAVCTRQRRRPRPDQTRIRTAGRAGRAHPRGAVPRPAAQPGVGNSLSPPTPASSTCSSPICASSSRPTARPGCCTPCPASASSCELNNGAHRPPVSAAAAADAGAVAAHHRDRRRAVGSGCRDHHRHLGLGRHHHRPTQPAGPAAGLAEQPGRCQHTAAQRTAARYRSAPAGPQPRAHRTRGRPDGVGAQQHRVAQVRQRLRQHHDQRCRLPGPHVRRRSGFGGPRRAGGRGPTCDRPTAPSGAADLRRRHRRHLPGRRGDVADHDQPVPAVGRPRPRDQRAVQPRRGPGARGVGGRRNLRGGRRHAGPHRRRATAHQGGAGVGPRLRLGRLARAAHPAHRHADQPGGAVHPGPARRTASGSDRRRHPHPEPDRGHADGAGAAGAGRIDHRRGPRPARHHRVVGPRRPRRHAGLPRPARVAGARAHGADAGTCRWGCGW